MKCYWNRGEQWVGSLSALDENGNQVFGKDVPPNYNGLFYCLCGCGRRVQRDKKSVFAGFKPYRKTKGE